MRDALAKTNRPILYSLCQWGNDKVWTWGNAVGNSWRATGDIQNNWDSIVKIGSFAGTIPSYSGPGGFNDFDMMEVGNGKLTPAEERTHFGLWCIVKSPIILGTDLTKISTSSLGIIKNKGLISVNQDSLGKAAAPFQPSGKPAPVSGKIYSYWAGPLSDGVVIGLIAVDGAATLSVNFTQVPGLGDGTYKWTELYSGASGSGTSVSATLDRHDMAVFKVSKA